jgi:hypothetical protein
MSLNGACPLGSLVTLNCIDSVLDLGGAGGVQVPPSAKPLLPPWSCVRYVYDRTIILGILRHLRFAKTGKLLILLPDTGKEDGPAYEN